MSLAPSYVILWGSQTGNAEWIAKSIHLEAKQRGYRGVCVVMNEWEKADLKTAKVIIFISSSTGDGEPPDNAVKFWEFFRRIRQPDYLSHASMTLLGLGDSNYSQFNNTIERVEKKALELGATLFCEKGLADDSVGLESIVDPWTKQLWKALPNVLQNFEPLTGSEEEIGIVISKMSLEDSGPYSMRARKARLPEEVKKYLDLSNSTIVKPDTNSEDKKLKIFKGHTLSIDLSGLKPGLALTAIPKVPASTIDLVLISKSSTDGRKTSIHNIPEFINTPTPMIDAHITKIKSLTTKDAVKRTLYVELDVGENIDFEPGDAFGVIAPNDEDLVNALVERLMIREEELNSIYNMSGKNIPSHFQSAKSVTIVELLTFGIDITSTPRKALFRMLAEYTKDTQEKNTLMYICSKQGLAQFNAIREQSPTLLDILTTFPSCQPPISRLLDVLPPHMPRYYSVSNSALKYKDKLSFAFNVVNYTTPKAIERRGMATSWIDKLTGLIPARVIKPVSIEFPSGHIHLPIFMKHNTNAFVLPKDTARPLVLIGPGTGITPFIGFLQHRQAQRKIRKSMGGVGINPQSDIEKEFGDIWVYYGFRETTKDFLFEEELNAFVKDGIIKKLALAVSRDNANKVYVQDLLKRDTSSLYELIVKRNAAIYVCGDAKGMAKGVNDALVDMLCENHGMDKLEASKLLIQWMSERKYLRDLWA
ncbi:hypothetical protein BDF14DRAFT_1785040 [Spinellus fusiger]|nr:hypothetical protein BDF14DRAFT_1785040 [Spinellus fusiger]